MKILKKSVIILSMALPFLYGCAGHTHVYDLENPVWNWADAAGENKTATATFTCSECDESKAGHTMTVDAEVVREQTTAPTCEGQGQYTYTATVTYEGVTRSATTTQAINSLGGHDYNSINVSGNFKTQGYIAFETFNLTDMVVEKVCSRDANHKETVPSTEYDVVYQQKGASTLLAGDTKVTIKVGNVTYDVTIQAVAKADNVISGFNTVDGYSTTCKAAPTIEGVSAASGSVTYKYYSDAELTNEVQLDNLVAGSYFIKASSEGNDNYNQKSVSGPLKVVHNGEITPAKDSTYETQGNYAYCYCSACDKYFNGKEGTASDISSSYKKDLLPSTDLTKTDTVIYDMAAAALDFTKAPNVDTASILVDGAGVAVDLTKKVARDSFTAYAVKDTTVNKVNVVVASRLVKIASATDWTSNLVAIDADLSGYFLLTDNITTITTTATGSYDKNQKNIDIVIDGNGKTIGTLNVGSALGGMLGSCAGTVGLKCEIDIKDLTISSVIGGTYGILGYSTAYKADQRVQFTNCSITEGAAANKCLIVGWPIASNYTFKDVNLIYGTKQGYMFFQNSNLDSKYLFHANNLKIYLTPSSTNQGIVNGQVATEREGLISLRNIEGLTYVDYSTLQ